jgi:DNA-binding transcriptional MerR regulator
LEHIDIKQLSKLYYTIGEVAEMFYVNTSLIRFWEKEFSIIQPKKSKKGNRMFTPKDIENFNKIYNLVKKNGYTLEGAKKVLKEKEKTPITAPNLAITDHSDIISKLEDIKSRLKNLRENY